MAAAIHTSGAGTSPPHGRAVGLAARAIGRPPDRATLLHARSTLFVVSVAMASMSFWGCVVKPGKMSTKLMRDPEDVSVVLKQVRAPKTRRSGTFVHLPLTRARSRAGGARA